MLKNFMRLAALPLLLIASIVTMSACGGASEPEDRQFDLEIASGKLNLEPNVIRVKQGDAITLRISSDEHGSVHLHGYDIEKDVGPDETTTMEFTADATGKFTITMHSGSGHGAHGEMFESETLLTGESFRFKIMDDMNGETIPYHNHMNHAMTGAIVVSDAADQSDAVEISIREDGSFNPAEITVKPGTELVWNNTSSERQRVASGEPPSEEDEEDEPTLGSLEVLPR